MPFRSKKQRLVKDCLWCRKTYKVQCPSRVERSKFCSHSCRQRWRYKNGEWDMTKIKKPKGCKDNYKPRICDHCGDDYKPVGNNQRFCKTCAPNFLAYCVLKRYGLSRPAYDAMVKGQDGRCALCPGKPTNVDHCHKTGKVRGILCNSCNLKMSGIDDVEWRKRAILYRKGVL
jgi:hypothetical protein